MLSSIFGSDPSIEIQFERKADVPLKLKYHSRIDAGGAVITDEDVHVPVYRDQQSVGGHADIVLPEKMTDFKYESINSYLIGQILCPQLGKDYIFMTETFPLAPESGILRQSTRYTFRFNNPALEKESFYGAIVELRYFVRVVVLRKGLMGTQLVAEEDFYVQNPTIPLERRMLKMEIGVEDEMKLEFNWDSSAMHCRSKLKGTIKFITGGKKIREIVLQILRREIVTTGYEKEPELVSTSPVGKFDIFKGEVDSKEIPILIYMSTIPQLTPTMTTKQFSVKYFLNLVLTNVDARKYFKSSEIIFWRK